MHTKEHTQLKQCQKCGFVEVLKYGSYILLWANGFLSSHDLETDNLADTLSKKKLVEPIYIGLKKDLAVAPDIKVIYYLQGKLPLC